MDTEVGESMEKMICPHCKREIDITQSMKEAIKQEALEEARKEYMVHMTRVKQLQNELQLEKAQILEKLQKEQEEEKRRIREELQKEKKQIVEQFQREQEERFQILQQELEEKSQQLRELHKLKAETERLKREKEEMRLEIEAQLQQQLTHQLREEREKIRKEMENSLNMKLVEKDIIIKQLQESLKEAQTKAEQGSTELQGEAQELAITKWLSENFPADKIEEVRRGEYGADILQTINDRNCVNCGKIAYESKRTKHWNSQWIEKFRDDIQRHKANIGILVTQTMPKEMERAGLVNGIWVCSFDEFKLISKILRNSIIDMNKTLIAYKNRDSKMALLYSYIVSPDFENRIQTILQSFYNMRTALQKEQNAIKRIWNIREKEIERVIENISSIRDSLQYIISSSENIDEVDMLEHLADEVELLE